MIEPISAWTGYDPLWIKMAIGLFALLILRWGWRNPWGLLRVTIIVALLCAAGYAAFELTKTGTSAKEALIEDKVDD